MCTMECQRARLDSDFSRSKVYLANLGRRIQSISSFPDWDPGFLVIKTSQCQIFPLVLDLDNGGDPTLFVLHCFSCHLGSKNHANLHPVDHSCLSSDARMVALDDHRSCL